MILSKDKVLDDLRKAATGAIGMAGSAARKARTQVREDLKARAEEMAARLDLVPREDFERLELMLAEARAQLDDHKARIEALEARGQDEQPSKSIPSLTAKRL